MALTESNMMPLGTRAPDFDLPEPLTKKQLSLPQVRGEKGVLVIFMCNHCPYVKHVIKGLVSLAEDYLPQGIGVVAISSNDISTHPQDAPERMAELASREAFPFPYLYDASQATAKAYQAACTPDFFLFDNDLSCCYRGRMDGSTPGNAVPVTGNELRKALDALLAGEGALQQQNPSIGCNIKWKHAG